MELADAYLTAGSYEKAIELYEPALSGLFEDNEHIIKQLMFSYYKIGRFDDILKITPRIFNSFDFVKSPANLYYAIALEETGKSDLAEKEYKNMNRGFCNYEARYYYANFLIKNNKKEEAAELINEMINESEHLHGKDRSNSKTWINKARQKYNK